MSLAIVWLETGRATTTTDVDQRKNIGQWYPLGLYSLADNLIENSGGVAPDVPGAIGQNYGEPKLLNGGFGLGLGL